MTPATPIENEESGTMAGKATRPFYWSVRRELWENRSIYIGPLVGAAVNMLAFLFSLMVLPRSLRELAAGGQAQRGQIVMPYGHATMLIFLAAFLVAVFYCLDALYGERRDRSILFWKSLPVSDLTAVLAKASVPLVVLPLIVLLVTIATHVVMLLLSGAVLLATGGGVALLWRELKFVQVELMLPYALTAMALWYAPIYGWLLLVSARVRHAAFLLAVFPPAVICAFEKLAFNTHYFASLLGYRLIGWFTQAFAEHVDPHFIPLSQLAPAKFLTTPGLWIGLLFAALFLAGAVRLRRDRGPI